MVLSLRPSLNSRRLCWAPTPLFHGWLPRVWPSSGRAGRIEARRGQGAICPGDVGNIGGKSQRSHRRASTSPKGRAEICNARCRIEVFEKSKTLRIQRLQPGQAAKGWPNPRLLLLCACVAATASRDGFAEDQPFQPPPLKVADGFEIELIAAPPLVGYPMLACLDDRGRLLIAESDGRNLKKDALLKERPRFVRRLEDTDGDGRFDRSTIFADRMIMPEGALWHDGALYIVSAPYLWRLEDTDDDGVADRRERILGEFEFDGRANQHGPYLGPHGRLYLTGGHFGVDLRGPDGRRVGAGSRTAGVFSCRTDGGEAEAFGLGTINPVEVVFTPSGDLLSTCAIFDSFGGRHDALVHWVRGGLTRRIYGESYLPDSGVRLPALCRWGQVAPAGLMRYRGTAFGREYRDNYFACHFNTHRVVRVQLQPQGATYRSTTEEFLASTSIDFHPTEILEDADGSLILLDTGGWLSWGCPTSKIAKPDVKGAIYRIRKRDAAELADPRGTKMDWSAATPAALCTRLDDLRSVVRDRAVEALVRHDGEALPALESVLRDGTPRARRLAAQILVRQGRDDARRIHRIALGDSDAAVRQTAVRGAGLLGDLEALGTLERLVVDDVPAIRRAAATALGRLRAAGSVPALFRSIENGLADDYLTHAQVYAIIEIGAVGPTRDGLSHRDARVRRAALVALDQMGKDTLGRDHLVPLLADASSWVRDTAAEILGRRGWGDTLREYLESRLSDAGDDPVLLGLMTHLVEDTVVQERLAALLSDGTTPPPTVSLILQAISRSSMGRLPPAFRQPFGALLAGSNGELKQRVLSLLERTGGNGLEPSLRRLSGNVTEPLPRRIAALSVLARTGATLTASEFEFLLARLRSPSLPIERFKAVRGLAGASLNSEQRHALVTELPAAFTLELPVLVSALERVSQSEDSGLGARLAEILPKVKSITSIPWPRLELLLKRHAVAGSVRETLRDRYAATDVEKDARLRELTAQLGAGSHERGERVFASQKAGCASCHRVRGYGGAVGPDLSRIGEVRQRSDLLEAIVFPSATLVNTYESYQVVARNGDVFSGVVRESNSDSIELATGAGGTVRIARDEIVKMVASETSLMPEGLEQGVSLDELSDLLAYLESLRGE